MPTQFSRPDRRPANVRMQDTIFKFAGQTATWRQFASAVSGVADAGEGSTYYYRESTITAVFGRGLVGQFHEYQAAAGMQAAGIMPMTSPHKVGRMDEIVFNNVTYRVESDPMPVRFLGHWQMQLKRGET